MIDELMTRTNRVSDGTSALRSKRALVAHGRPLFFFLPLTPICLNTSPAVVFDRPTDLPTDTLTDGIDDGTDPMTGPMPTGRPGDGLSLIHI